MKKVIIIVIVVIILCCVLGCGLVCWFNNNKQLGVKDDWKYSTKKSLREYGIGAKNIMSATSSAGMMMTESVSMNTADSYLGFSTGGAKNIKNFRENIENGYFPISTDITYNGLFYDYYFDTGRNENKSEELFSPSYSMAVSKDPISNRNEYYMTVGLNSNIKQSDFAREKLNLVVVLDISGSMSSSFDSYYYDGENKKSDNKTKMKIANESVNLLIDELKDGDRLGIVLFDDDAYLAKPLNLIEETDINKIKKHVLEIEPQGGTNFSAGYSKAIELYNDKLLDNSEYENRIVVITDAMPNLGVTSKSDLTKMVEDNSKKGLYTTFIGVGVDFNTEVIECLTNVKGANYYSVHNSDEFAKIMSDDFEYMVTPLVFDLELNFDSKWFHIENVYGTDCKDKNSGTIMKVNTLFPSSSNSKGESKGGIILLKLAHNYTCGTGVDEEILNTPISERVNKLTVTYTDRNGNKHSNSQEVKFKNNTEAEYYDNTGIRKGIVLARYANVMKDWILSERLENRERVRFLITDETGIIESADNIEEIKELLGENERRSTVLTVSDEYKEVFSKFKAYMEKEIKEVNDSDMNKEVKIIDLLISK